MSKCMLCNRRATQQHHIVPDSIGNWIKKNIKQDLVLIREVCNKKVSLCEECHNRIHKERYKPFFDSVMIASNSKCSKQPCLYERKFRMRNCNTCKIIRSFDFMNYYDWFASEFKLPSILEKAVAYYTKKCKEIYSSNQF